MPHEPYKPILGRLPDGRVGRFPLFEPVAFGYLAVSLGGPVASVCALYNGLLLRRTGLVLRAIVIGALSFVCFFVAVTSLIGGGTTDGAVIRLVGSLIHLLFGALLAASQWDHFRGHRLLGGAVVPLLGTVIAGVLLRTILPTEVVLILLGFPL